MFDADDRKKAINNLVLVFRQSDGWYKNSSRLLNSIFSSYN